MSFILIFKCPRTVRNVLNRQVRERLKEKTKRVDSVRGDVGVTKGTIKSLNPFSKPGSMKR